MSDFICPWMTDRDIAWLTTQTQRFLAVKQPTLGFGTFGKGTKGKLGG